MTDKVHGARLAVAVHDTDHIRGRADASVTLVEYGDYECDYCANAQPIIQQLLKLQGDRLRFVFRHFPLNSVHSHASVAAQAAEAAAAQEKFWPMHDLLYENQKQLAGLDLGRLALSIGLELYRFEADMAAERFAARVHADFRGGVRSGVSGTPSFFINDLPYTGKLAMDDLVEAVRRAGG
jgi:protein-disulfide isomerase